MPQTDLVKARKNAATLGVEVKKSTKTHKKLDVFRSNQKLASIGDKRYTDFLQTGDKEQQKRYKSRHQKTRVKVGTPSFYADRILWS